MESAAGGTWSGVASADQLVQRDEARHRSRRQHDRHRLRAQSSTDVEASALTRLVREARGRLYATRDLWRLLPQQVCDELTVTAFDNNSLCWDGRSYRFRLNMMPRHRLFTAGAYSRRSQGWKCEGMNLCHFPSFSIVA